MLQEAKQKATSNEFLMSSERAEFKTKSLCGSDRHLRENGTDWAKQIIPYTGKREGGGGGGNIFVLETSPNDSCNLCTY